MFAKARTGIVEEHHAEAREDEIVRRMEQMHGSVGLAEVDAASPRPRNGEHRLGDVHARDASLEPDSLGQRIARRARAAADVEHALPRPRIGEFHQRSGDLRQARVDCVLQLGPALADRSVPVFDLLGIGGHVFSFLLRIASVRRRRALSLMKPAASFWS